MTKYERKRKNINFGDLKYKSKRGQVLKRDLCVKSKIFKF